ncbi:DUF2690 domain-containing protein [Micromonospora chaiyaphumensis]|uniref:DUF2690 domain-containing protein n=1 Tax=Micromonospora chaiyaphumensis TaxID=307119 RepID=A0A1C4XSY3_9ACTN|nr:DUF2690 domain-containing protein [Micromonospora chaiyaphumensis]SCF11568.1 Protein of unknown function [Micromonospora chaiyaphumensis]
MKRLLLIPGLMSALALSLLGPPAPAQAAPVQTTASAEVDAVIAAGEGTRIDATTLATTGCGASCDGKSPYFKIYYNGSSYYTCNDDAIIPTSGTYVYTASDVLGNVTLRYSPRCRTAWARTSAGDVQFKVVSRYTSGTYRTTMTGSSPAEYTVMVNDAGLEAQACYHPNGPYEGWNCTRWW